MKRLLTTLIFVFLVPHMICNGQDTLKLNGVWQFEQTARAIPPARFTRKIPVPGLIHLAVPKIDQYDVLVPRPEEVVTYTMEHNLQDRKYKPVYNWYYRKINVPKDAAGKHAVLTLLKSKYVTRVFINGMDAGSSMECFTPIDFPVTPYLKPGQDNEILIQVGDRAWLPSEAAGGTDKEKVNYLPGIWDDVFITFSGNFAVSKILLLPSIKEKKVNAKLQIRSFYPPQLLYGASMYDSGVVEIGIRERSSGKTVATAQRVVSLKRDNITTVEIPVGINSPHLWTPDDPFLYVATVRVLESGKVSQVKTRRFGMREFGRQGKFFTLNGEKIILRGTNITLHRFFEDPDCKALPWDRTWVRKLLTEAPAASHWNMMRICVGLAPDFWYDIADESGLMLQNEWMYWQNHGWDEQIRKEYTNWVWSDGNHPSIVIWDAINENWDSYIGQELIPELKKLDNTRLWDAGYMTTADLGTLDEMDEPHPYVDVVGDEDYSKRKPYPMGDLDYSADGWLERFNSSSVPQLANEYAWLWLWRNGSPSKLTVHNYNYYLGENATADQRREFQAYALQLQTEWLRSERSVAGVLQFCYLTNNYGFTGDAFIGAIRDLTPSPMLKWFSHCFAPAAAFIDLTDERYVKQMPPHEPGSILAFSVFAVNDLSREAVGKIVLRLMDSTGTEVLNQTYDVKTPAYGRTSVPCMIKLPAKRDGYLLVAEYTSAHESKPVKSRRYLKVGADSNPYSFYEMQP